MDKNSYAIEVYDNNNEKYQKGNLVYMNLDRIRYYDSVSNIVTILSRTGEERQDWDFEITEPFANKFTFTLRIYDTESGNQLSRHVHDILDGLRIR